MDHTWVVIANGSLAHLYASDHHIKQLTLIETVDHPDSRVRTAAVASDRAGSFQAGSGHGDFEHSLPKDQAMVEFARDIVEMLENARNSHRFQHLIICASPHFYGLINKSMPKGLAQMVRGHLGKDYTHLGVDELQLRLREHLLAK
jgi:protein required for attachment to host cells